VPGDARLQDSGNEADDTNSDPGEEDGNDEEFANESCRESSGLSGSNGGSWIEKGKEEEEYCGRALYAEERKHVSIIFSDVVKFSRIVDGAPASKVMDMLHNLFHRYDCLCEKHGIFKVETIGDGCVMAAGLIDEDDRVKNDKDNARRALAIAQDMVREARKVRPPRNRHGERPDFLEIRVGIHQGDITCGVLGKKQPRFQVFGSAVNMAARMEQSGSPSAVHVSNDFRDLVDLPASVWCEQRKVTVKNMGEVDTWLLDPFSVCMPASSYSSSQTSFADDQLVETELKSPHGSMTFISVPFKSSRDKLSFRQDEEDKPTQDKAQQP